MSLLKVQSLLLFVFDMDVVLSLNLYDPKLNMINSDESLQFNVLTIEYASNIINNDGTTLNILCISDGKSDVSFSIYRDLCLFYKNIRTNNNINYEVYLSSQTDKDSNNGVITYYTSDCYFILQLHNSCTGSCFHGIIFANGYTIYVNMEMTDKVLIDTVSFGYASNDNNNTYINISICCCDTGTFAENWSVAGFMLLWISGNEINDFVFKKNGISLQQLISALLTNMSRSYNIILNAGNSSTNTLLDGIYDPRIVIRVLNLEFTITNLMECQLIDLLIRLVQIVTLLRESHKIMQNSKEKSNNKYTNKELRFVMNKLSDFYVIPNDLSSIKSDTTAQFQFNQYINFTQYQYDVIIIILLPDFFAQKQRPLLNLQKISEAVLTLKETSIASISLFDIPPKTDDEISFASAPAADSTNNDDAEMNETMDDISSVNTSIRAVSIIAEFLIQDSQGDGESLLHDVQTSSIDNSTDYNIYL